MALVRAQVTLPLTGLTVGYDAAVNTFAFECDEATPTGVANAETALVAFYVAVSGFLSNRWVRSGTSIRWYDMAAPTPRPAFHETLPGASMGTGTSTMPLELAVCMSFQGIPVAGVSQARRRGRIFLGPVTAAANAGNGLVDASFTTAVATAGDGLLTASNLASDWTWVILHANGTLAAIVDNGWVDNAFDIQRRRGDLPTLRSAFS